MEHTTPWAVGATRATRVAAHGATTATGLSVDSGASRGATGRAARTTPPGTHPAVRGDSPLGSDGSRPDRPRGRAGRADRSVDGRGARRALRERAGAEHFGAGVRGALRPVGHQPKHVAGYLGGHRRGLARGA